MGARKVQHQKQHMYSTVQHVPLPKILNCSFFPRQECPKVHTYYAAESVDTGNNPTQEPSFHGELTREPNRQYRPQEPNFNYLPELLFRYRFNLANGHPMGRKQARTISMGARKVISRRLKPHNDLGLAREVQRGCRLGAILLPTQKSLNQAEEEDGGTKNSPRLARRRERERARRRRRRRRDVENRQRLPRVEERRGKGRPPERGFRSCLGRSLEDIIFVYLSEVDQDGRPRSFVGGGKESHGGFALHHVVGLDRVMCGCACREIALDQIC
jgi:hypothetical protein